MEYLVLEIRLFYYCSQGHEGSFTPILRIYSLLETLCGDLTALELLCMRERSSMIISAVGGGSATHLCSRQSWKYLKDKQQN